MILRLLRFLGLVKEPQPKIYEIKIVPVITNAPVGTKAVREQVKKKDSVYDEEDYQKDFQAWNPSSWRM